jgi:hypothetical protein
MGVASLFATSLVESIVPSGDEEKTPAFGRSLQLDLILHKGSR